ncbi:AarF/ABC1/UbiB kinase family protein [Candidatus Woesearchaeota archaeon]|nr:AarF/ABC1/UbiB kinase family protein [Candidatus Woesearchaeota archaeon]
MASKFRDLKRTTQIVRVLWKHGLGKIIYDVGLKSHLPFTKKVPLKVYDLPKDLPDKIRAVFEELGGAFIKLGQLLSVRPDLVPHEYTDALRSLRDNLPPVSFEQIRKVIEEDFGKRVEDLFAGFDTKPLGSASIAQVYKALLHNKKHVVVKIKRPNAKRDFESDIDIMYFIAHRLEKYYKDHISPLMIVKEFERYTKNELDLLFEGRNIDRFYHSFEGDERVVIPKLYWQYSTNNVLTMEHIKGIKLKDILKYKDFDKKKIAQTIVDVSISQVFDHGIFHADLHPGNILVLESNKIAMLDFGIVGTLTRKQKIDGLNLFVAVINRDIDEIMKILVSFATPSEKTSLSALQQDVEGILNEWYDAKNARITQIMYFIINTCVKNKMSVPVDIVLYGKSFMTVEGTCVELVPGFNFIEAARPKMLEVLKREKSPRKIVQQFVKKSREIADSLSELPREAFELIEKIKSGRLTFDFKDADIRHLGMDINLSSNRLSYAIVIAALVIAGALFVDLPPKYAGYSFFTIICLSIATLFLISLGISIFIEGRTPYDRHRRE